MAFKDPCLLIFTLLSTCIWTKPTKYGRWWDITPVIPLQKTITSIFLADYHLLDEASCHVGEAHRTSNRVWPIVNNQRRAKVLSPAAHEKLNVSNRQQRSFESDSCLSLQMSLQTLYWHLDYSQVRHKLEGSTKLYSDSYSKGTLK